jgi:uncharacterized ParB-like nuclease family protein
MVCIEGREQGSHRFEGCHRLRTYSRCPARQTGEADTDVYGHPYSLQIRSQVSNVGERSDERPLSSH